MREPKPSIDSAMQHVAATWDQARTERTLAGVHRKRAQRRRRAALASGTGVLLVIGSAALLALRVGREPVRAPAAAVAATQRTIGFVDGSRALLLDATASVVVERTSDTAIDVRLPAGRARFEVVARKARTFRVMCDSVVVQVLGTGFELIRDGARTHVRVLHGRVAVTWPDGAIELGAGEAGWFPASDTDMRQPAPATEASAEATTDAPAGQTRTEPERARTAGWRQQAEQGDFQKAYQMLARQPARLSDDVEELLLAADAARLSGHAVEAVPYLQRVVQRHADDPRAPLAAFTLGGVLMNQLGRPREAAASYARARAMSPRSALSQDALARQVEAAHRAADGSAARALALEYLDRYPRGRRVQAVRRFGGLP